MDFYNYKGELLKEYVIKNKTDELLNNDELRSYLLQNENHYAFVWLVQDLDEKSKSILLNNKYLEEIIDKDDKALYKFNAIMQSYPACLKNVSEKVMDFVIKPYNNGDYNYFDFELATQVFNYILKNNSDKIYLISYFSDNVLKKILTYENVLILSKNYLFNEMFNKFKPSIIKYLLNYDVVRKIINNYSNNQLIYFSLVIKNISVEDELLNDNNFIKKVANMENPNIFRNIINNLSVNNYELVNKINKSRTKYLNKKISDIDSNCVFNEYINLYKNISEKGIDSTSINQIPMELLSNKDIITYNDLAKISVLRRFEYVCDNLFEDYTYNVLINLKNITEFDGKHPYLNESMRKLYNKILNFDKLNKEEQLELLKKSIGNSISNKYYDDFRTARDLSYKTIQDNLLNLNERKELYDKEKSIPLVSVYKLDGEDFVSCVHCGTLNQKFKDTISLSIIGSNHIGVFNPDGIIFGFDNISSDKIIHSFNTDSFTNGKFGTDRVNKIYDVHDLLKETKSCNEILYDTKREPIKPSYLVCFDNINEESYIYSVNNNLPILLINSKKYNKNNGMYETDKYQESYRKEDDYYGKRL